MSYYFKKFLGGISIGLGIVVIFGAYLFSQAVAPGSVANPGFSPADDDVSASAQFVAGNEVNGLTPGTTYIVSVYGITANRGTGGATLNPVVVQTCSGTNLAVTWSGGINWHDGNAPQSATFAIVAPASGCIRGFTDNGGATNMTVFAVP